MLVELSMVEQRYLAVREVLDTLRRPFSRQTRATGQKA
jgi:hypothetical protein